MQNPTHTYSSYGIYSISLNASSLIANSTSSTTTLYFQKSAVVIGDSIARGLAFGRVDLIWGPDPTWNSSYRPDTTAAVSYDSEIQKNYTAVSLWDWRYNMGWGGQTTANVRTRWLRDAIGQGVALGDGLPTYTLDNKTPHLILMQVGINDITSAVAISTIESNIMYCAVDANTRGIPIIIVSIFPKAAYTANINTVNTWENVTFHNNASMPNVRYVDAYSLLDNGAGSIKAAFDNGDGTHINNNGYVALTAKIYNENEGLFGAPISASFTQSSNPSNTGQAVTFTDTSTGSPVTWNWTFGDINAGNTSAVQNPTHTYTIVGVYNVFLNVTNSTGSWSNTSQTHTVYNASIFVPQDIWMTAQYAQTFHLTNSNTLAPIGNVTITSIHSGTATTDVGGTALMTTVFGPETMTFSAAGYTSKSVAYVFDSDASHDVALDPVGAAPSQNTWWTPHTVQVTVLDANYGTRLYDVDIKAHYNESSMPVGWINTLYGIGSTVQADMINKTLIMDGTTGSEGTVTFTMLGSIKYDFVMTAAQYGISNYTVMAYPSDNMINIYVLTAGSTLPTQLNSTYTNLNGTRVYFTEPDINNVSMCIDYIDKSGETTSVTFIWQFANNGTQFNTTTVNPGTGLNTICNVTRNIKGTQVWWGYNSTVNYVG